MTDLIFHCDNGAILLPPKPELTREGFLRAYLRIARAGNLTYRNPDGTERVERVTSNVLFDSDSMDSFAGKPVTLLHPPRGVEVTPDNAATYTKGLLGHFPVQDGEFLGFGATITHRDAIDAVLSKKIKQVSSGYLAHVQKRADGLFDQTKRLGNHAAIVPLGRAGEKVSFVLDGDEEESDAAWIWQVDEVGDDYFQVSDTAIAALKDLQPRLVFDFGNNPKRTKKLRKDKQDMPTQLLIGKKLIRVDSEDAAAVDALQAEVTAISERADQAESEKNALQLKLDEATAKVTALTSERDALQAKVDAASTTEVKADTSSEGTSDLKERLQLIREVSPFLSSELPEYKEDSLYDLTPHEIKSAYLVVKNPTLKERLDSASEDYIAAFYDAQKPEPTTTGRGGSSRVDDILGKIAGVAEVKQDAGKKSGGYRAERIRKNGLKSMGMEK